VILDLNLQHLPHNRTVAMRSESFYRFVSSSIMGNLKTPWRSRWAEDEEEAGRLMTTAGRWGDVGLMTGEGRPTPAGGAHRLAAMGVKQHTSAEQRSCSASSNKSGHRRTPTGPEATKAGMASRPQARKCETVAPGYTLRGGSTLCGKPAMSLSIAQVFT
jgi:hypothetical protein